MASPSASAVGEAGLYAVRYIVQYCIIQLQHIPCLQYDKIFFGQKLKVSFCAETVSDLRWERTRDTQEETVDDREAGAGAARAPRWLTFPYKREKKWGPQVHLRYDPMFGTPPDHQFLEAPMTLFRIYARFRLSTSAASSSSTSLRFTAGQNSCSDALFGCTAPLCSMCTTAGSGGTGWGWLGPRGQG